MYISANYAQIRCTECKKTIHIYPDQEFKQVACDCVIATDKKPKSRAKQKDT